MQWLSIERVQDMPPQNIPLWYIDYFEPKALEKQQMQRRLSLNSSYLTKDRCSKSNSVINPLDMSFINQGTLTPITGEETSGHHSQTHFVTNHHTSHLPFF